VATKSPGGIVVPQITWQTLATPFVAIRHAAGYDADAEVYARFIESTHRALRTEFSPIDVDTLIRTPVTCTVWLHPQPSSAVNAANALASTAYGSTPVCELHFLTPSAYGPTDQCCTKIGEQRTQDQLHRIVAHEYSTIVLDRLTRQRVGWRFHDAPEWFEQGFEEYLGCVIASEHTRTITLAKYRELLAKATGGLRNGVVENPYIDGAVLVQMMHERFGREKVRDILLSPAKTFNDAFRDALGINPSELFDMARLELAKK
jgi:hypothetical protein